MNFFNKVPTISYNGYTAKNLITRAALSDNTRSNRLIYYPYEYKEEDRVDMLSYHYYDSPKYMWLVWMSNNIVDPYYGLALTESEFYDHITAKYGSLDYAMGHIKCYRNNWYEHTDQISVESFNSLSAKYRKYYDPVVNYDYKIMGYVRKRDDDIVSTNRTVLLVLDSVLNVVIDDRVAKDANNYGFVQMINGTTLVVQHITGSFSVGDTVNGAKVLSVTPLSSTVASDDALCWSAVSYYDYEHELNEAKKSIKLIDARYRDSLEAELKRVLNA